MYLYTLYIHRYICKLQRVYRDDNVSENAYSIRTIFLQM